MDKIIVTYEPETGNIEINSKDFRGPITELIGVLTIAANTVIQAESTSIGVQEIKNNQHKKRKYDA